MRKMFLSAFYLILLFCLSLAGAFYNIELFRGIDFFFSSIFIFLIIYFFGTLPGVLAAVSSGIYTVFLWGNPFGLIMLTLEAWFVGHYFKKTVKSLIYWDAIFLTAVSIPLSLLFSHAFLGMDWLGSILIMLKQSMNMLLNVLIANLLIIIIEATRLGKHKRKVSLQELLFNLLILFFLFPAVLSLINQGRSEMELVRLEIQSKINHATDGLVLQFNNFYHTHTNQLERISRLIETGEYDEEFSKDLVMADLIFIKNSFPSFKIVSILKDEKIKYSFNGGDETFNLPEKMYPSPSEANQRESLSNLKLATPSFPEPYVTLSYPISQNSTGLVLGQTTGIISAEEFPSFLEEHSSRGMFITLYDENQRIIASTDKSRNTYEFFKSGKKELPYKQPIILQKEENIQSLQEWMQHSYSLITPVSKDIPWKIHISMPVSSYKEQLYRKFIFLMFSAFLFAAAALALSYGLSYWIQNSLKKVALITDNLPEKISRSEKIQWPDVVITEVTMIIENFKKTETKIRTMFSDIVEAREDLSYLAHFDPLTNVYNRSFVIEIFKDLISRQKERKMAVFFIDLDRFKIVNDTLGHHTGDMLLQEVAAHLKERCSIKEVIARQGGDEFIILLPSIDSAKEAEEMARKILQSISDTYLLQGESFYITASLGISLYPDNGRDIQGLMKNAEMAMYKAKEQGKNNFHFYNSDIRQLALSKVRIENELRMAIEKKQLQLYYQPQVDLRTLEITGVEALVRWFHPEMGMVPPSDFIPVAEESGLIIEIGEWIVAQACRDAGTWKKLGARRINFSVNVSMKQFLHENLIPSIQKHLSRNKLNHKRLKLEITESLAMSQPEKVMQRLKLLNGLDIDLALDDFGTGYSSLHHLKHLPVNILKIDRSFIKDMDVDEKDTAIVKALIDVAHSLGMEVIAEGVETVKQKQILKEIGCDTFQGYAFSKPLPNKELVPLLLQSEKISV